MADYPSIFEVLGVYARAFEQLENWSDRNLLLNDGGQRFRSLDRLRQEFATVLNSSASERDQFDAIVLLADAARQCRGWSVQMQQSLDNYLRGTVAAELGLRGASAIEAARALARAMGADNESVTANGVALDGPEAASANAGDTPCYASLQTVNDAEELLPDERARTQRVTLQCVRDAAHHRLPVGQEEFRAAPEFGPAATLRVIPVTAGDFPDSRNVVMDGAFESHDGSDFAYWDAASGPGVFSRDTTNKLFGTGSLKLTGDGLTAAMITQDFAGRDPAVPSGGFVALGAWVRVASLAAGSVTVDLLVDGVPSTLALVADAGTATGTWLHLGGLLYLPRACFPNKVVLRVACSADFDGVVNLDGISLAAATELPQAGLKLALFQGAQAPCALPIADRFTLATSSDDAGKFQSFARDRLGCALPSSEAPTIDDELAS